MVRKPVENEQTFVLKRIVHKLDLNKIYPEKSPVMGFNVTVTKTSSSPDFKRRFDFILDDSNVIYFLTSVDQPATLRVNIYLNSTLKPTEDLRKYTKVFDVKEDKARKTHLFQLKTTNSLEEILKSEKALLDNFETKLWKSAKPCKDCLSIAYIRPNQAEYEIGVASTQRHSDLLDEFCFFNSIPADHLKVANLAINRKVAQCESIRAAPKQPIEDYTFSVFLTVGTKPMVHTRMFPPVSPEILKPVVQLWNQITG